MTITTPPPVAPAALAALTPPRQSPRTMPTWSAAKQASPAVPPVRPSAPDQRDAPPVARRAHAGPPWGHGTGPFSTLSVAADAAVRELARQAPLDLWLVTHLDGDRQRVLATAGPWAERAGSELGWQAGLCAGLVAEGGAGLVADLAGDPSYRARAAGRSLVPASWVGVPLVSAHGALFGALCGMGATASAPGLSGALEPVQVMGRMLSTLIAGEQVAARRTAAAAAERARGERDRLTGLLDRHGWTAALAGDRRSSAWSEDPLSLLVLDVDDLRSTNEAEGHEAGDAHLVAVAGVLGSTCWSGDVIARVDGDEFAVMAGCDAVSVRVLASRLKVRLGAVGVSASVGWAVRRPREVLSSTWERAEQAMALDKRRHRRR